MAKFSMDKVNQELDKLETPEELKQAFDQLKDYITEKLLDYQKQHQEKGETLQSFIDSMKG